MSQFPPGPPPQGPGGPPSQPGWGQQPPSNPPGFPPQQPSQPGYGQQPYPPAMPPAKGGGGGGAKILIILGVVAVLGVGAFFAFGGDDDGGSGGGGGSPKAAVETFFAASKDADCEKLMSVITEATWNEDGETSREDALKECNSESEGETPFPEDTEVSDIKTVAEEESTATVNATVTAEGETVELAFPLVKEDGGWKIDLNGIGPASDIGGEIPGDGGDLPDGSDDEFDTDTSLPDIDLDDIPEECNPESSEYDMDACIEAMEDLPELGG